MKISLTQGFETIVDEEDFENLSKYKWHASVSLNHTYAHRMIVDNGKRKKICMHRDIISCPKDMVVDHINGNSLDNRKINLRICSNRDNVSAFRTLRRNKSSKYRGVSFRKGRGKWIARIRKNNKLIYIGSSLSELEAAKMWDAKAIEIFGTYAVTNF